MADMSALHCPTHMVPGLNGCGSTNLEGPDDEGFYDCVDCGMWFTYDEGTSDA
jgi:hypothetical protein